MNLVLSPSILVIDDQSSILLAVDTALRLAGFSRIRTCGDGRQVQELVGQEAPDIVLLDLMMPGVDGETLLSFFSTECPDVPVIVITGRVDAETAVRCMKAGAFDYILKPVEDERLVATVQRAAAYGALQRENQALRRQILAERTPRANAFSEIITRDSKMLAVFQYVEAIATTLQPVLIRGETGVGKELVARALHRLSGLPGAFVAVNVGGLDDNVFSDTLFGHVRGAFTGADRDRPGMIEASAGGTLFLDEIGDLSPASQVKLLRLLQEGEYMPLGMDRPRRSDARIVASTNVSLRALERAGRFRKDLAYRLRTHQIYLPPLRERLDDLPLLVDHFLDKAARVLNRPRPAAPAELMALLRSHLFAGNVRELESMIFDALSRHRSGPLELTVFRDHIRREQAGGAIPFEPAGGAEAIVFPARLPTIKEAARMLVAEALKRTEGNQTAAAALLGISQQALSKRLHQGK
jgi:DNA-binding NtrC family response regulator